MIPILDPEMCTQRKLNAWITILICLGDSRRILRMKYKQACDTVRKIYLEDIQCSAAAIVSNECL